MNIDLDIFLDVVNLIDVVHNNEEENIYRRQRDMTVQSIVKFDVIIYLNIKDECLKFPKINCGI